MNDENEKSFQVTVDGESVEISRKETTPKEILEKAGLDPTDRYLIQIHGQKKVSYKGDPDQIIHIHENEVFITGKCGAVAVA